MTVAEADRQKDRGRIGALAASALGGRRLSPGSAFSLQTSMLVFFLAGSSAPTPLYSVYQAEWSFSPITITVIFGIYALAVLAALLTVGSLSDHIGRRPVLLAAVVGQAAVMVVFATATGVPELVVARVLQGLSTGAAVGALGAGLLDLDKGRGAIASAVGPLSGTAIGAIGSGLLVQFLPAPTRLVYLVLFAVFVAQAAGVAMMPETSARKAGALASLRPRFALPPATRVALFTAAPALVAVWSLAGLYGSLGPELINLLAGTHSLLLGGLGLFVLAASAAAAVYLLRSSGPHRMMLIGTASLLVGAGITLAAIAGSSIGVFFAGAIIAGGGFGAAFQGAVRTVAELAAPHERAGVLSLLFVVSYLAMGLPAVLAGYLVVHGGGVLGTAEEYTVAVMALTSLALLGLLWRGASEEVEPVTEAAKACACAAAGSSPVRAR